MMEDCNSRDVLKNFLPQWQDFLNKWYHSLTYAIRPTCFYSYLRSRRVLNLDDQELIEKSYVTTAMKAGCLIDTIATKGEKGFIAFMEVIEFSYPDLFHSLTHLKPRCPPTTYQPTTRASTSDYLIEFLASLGDNLKEKRDQLGILQETIYTVKDEYEKEIENLKNSNETLSRSNDQLQDELDSLRKREESQTELYEETMKQRDLERERNSQLRERCQTMSSKVAFVRKASLGSPKSGVCDQKKLEELREELKMVTDDNDQLKSVCEHLQVERDMYKKTMDDRTEECKQLYESKKNLELECQKYMMKCHEVVGIVEKLEKEIQGQNSENFLSNHIKQDRIKPAGKENCGSSEKRFASMPVTGASPLMVYSSEDVEKEIKRLLTSYFKKCPVDVIHSEDEMTECINNLDILHYEDMRDDGYHCVKYSRLKELKETTLLDMPVTSIPRLNRASIKPVLILIKFQNRQDLSELIKEEEFLEKHQIEFYKINADEEEKKDLKKFVESKLPEIKSLTQ